MWIREFRCLQIPREITALRIWPGTADGVNAWIEGARGAAQTSMVMAQIQIGRFGQRLASNSAGPTDSMPACH